MVEGGREEIVRLADGVMRMRKWISEREQRVQAELGELITAINRRKLEAYRKELPCLFGHIDGDGI